MTPIPPETTARRHDLDALRAVAMLLGIALHVALSFVPGVGWGVEDSQKTPAFGLLIAVIHGFRMALFFLISGYFTAMLWRKRGLAALIKQRARRILLPCLIGVATIVPLTIAAWVVAYLGKEKADAGTAAVQVDQWTAARKGNVAVMQEHLAAGVPVNALHPVQGVSLLTVAAQHDRTKIVKLLLSKGADVNLQNRDGGTALHLAALLGRAEVVELLLEHGADHQLRNLRGATAQELLQTSWGETQMLAFPMQIELKKKELIEGRSQADAHFVARGLARIPGLTAEKHSDDLLRQLMLVPIFHHLWFLWFLCWLVVAFAIYAWLVEKMKWQARLPAWLVSSPTCYLWLIPLTLIPQCYMGEMIPAFGPDTSIGLIPLPHVLAYYAIFFAFGVFYYDHNATPVGAGWRWKLPLLLFVIFPLGLEFTTGSFGFRQHLVPAGWFRLLASVFQVIYAWGMTFACIGLFRSVFHGESRVWRYISDSSYWLYLAHLPLVIFVQHWVKDWPVPAVIKFALITALTTGILLMSYQYFVRYTWIGRMLNGPREKPSTGGVSPQTTAA